MYFCYFNNKDELHEANMDVVVKETIGTWDKGKVRALILSCYFPVFTPLHILWTVGRS